MIRRTSSAPNEKLKYGATDKRMIDVSEPGLLVLGTGRVERCLETVAMLRVGA